MIKHIAFTMYPVKDMARARKFYENDLGLALTNNFRDEWVEYILENGCFAISTMIPKMAPSSAIAFEVDDVDATVKDLKAKNVKVKVEPFSTPVCRMAIIQDPDGNAFTVHAKTR